MLTTLWLINSLLADPQWNLFRSVFPDDANSAVVAIANPRGLISCVSNAIFWCDRAGEQSVCSICFIAEPDGTEVCSYICGDPSVPNGCAPPPPCPPWPPKNEVGMEPLVSIEPKG